MSNTPIQAMDGHSQCILYKGEASIHKVTIGRCYAYQNILKIFHSSQRPTSAPIVYKPILHVFGPPNARVKCLPDWASEFANDENELEVSSSSKFCRSTSS
jgi:hypothetical protein